MDATLSLQFVAYLLIIAAGILWIAIDAETVWIFEVFGRSFHFVWYEDPDSWRTIRTYAWRLLLLLTLILGASVLAFAMAFRQWQATHYLLALLFGGLGLAPILLVPWIQSAQTLRWQRLLDHTTKRLTPIAQQLAEGHDRALALGATYKTIDDVWDEWHAPEVDTWANVWPIADVHTPSGTVYFQIRSNIYKEYFLAWSESGHDFSVGSVLPPIGDDAPHYRLAETWPLSDAPNWTLIEPKLIPDAVP